MSADSRARTKRGKLWIGAILLVALALRMGWVLTRPADNATIDALPDQRDYLELARNLLHGPGLQFVDRRFADAVLAFRMPGYPLLLAACGANVRAVRAVQAVLDTSTVLAAWLLAMALPRSHRAPGAALLAAILVGLNPFLIYFSGLLLSETFFTAIITWSMVLLVRAGGRGAGDRGATLRWLGGGALLALSVLVRPSALGLPIILGIASVFVNRPRPSSYHRPQPRRLWAPPIGATMLLLTMLALLPWSLRNLHVLGRWMWLDTNAGFTLYDGYNPDATGASDQRFVSRLPELQVLDEVDRSDYLSQAAMVYARAHPGRAAALAGAKLARTWSPVPLSNEYGRSSYRLVALLWTIPLYVLILLGLLWGDLSRSAKVFLVVPAIYFSGVHALTVGSLRYRMPVEPALAVLGASVLGARSGSKDEWRRVGDASDGPH